MSIESSLVSIIVPTKNSASLLELCLKSIQDQSYKNIELIVVDNFSTDGTQELAKKYTDKVFEQGPERSAQVNYGVERATGTFVYKVDSDFVLDSEVVAQCVEEISKGFDAIVVHNSPDVRVSWIAKIRKFEVDMYKYDITHSSARFVKKEVYQKIGGFNSKITAGEDYDFQNKLNRQGFKTGFIEAEALHLGEPTNFWRHMKKYYDYGKDFVNYQSENEAESKEQLSFVRPVYVKHWRSFLRHPILALGFGFYSFFKFFFGGLGFLKARYMKSSVTKSTKRVLLLGTHGQKNIGDELLLHTFLHNLRKYSKNKLEFFVNSYLPHETAYENSVTSFHTLRDKWKLVQYIFKCDVVIFAGGSILKELYSAYGRGTYSVLNMLVVLTLFTKYIARKQIILSNIGIGALNTKRGLIQTRLVLNACDFISVRDQASVEYANKAQPKSLPLLVPDAVFSLDVDDFLLATSSHSVSPTNTIALNLCRNISDPAKWDRFIEELATSIIRIYQHNQNLKIVGIPMQSGEGADDYSTLVNFSQLLKDRVPNLTFTIAQVKTHTEVAHIINEANVLIAERLHAVIMASILAKPFLALEYDVKVTSYLEDIGFSNCGIKICENFNEGAIFDSYSSMMKDYNEIQSKLKNIASERRRITKDYFSLLAEKFF